MSKVILGKINDEPKKLTFVKRSFGAKFPYLRIPLAKKNCSTLSTHSQGWVVLFLKVLIYLKVFFLPVQLNRKTI